MSLTTEMERELSELADQPPPRTPTKLHALEYDEQNSAMLGFINELIDEVGDRETHPLMGLLDIVTFFVCHCERAQHGYS